MPDRPVTDPAHPDFALEALEGTDPTEQRELLELVHRLPDAFPSGGAPTKSLRSRLLTETSTAPERYAPFVRKLSELYDISRVDAQRLLVRSADPHAWKMSGLPGIRKLPVKAGPSRGDAQAYLVTFAAGARFPAHHHDGRETVLLLAGSYKENTGKVYTTGDTHLMEPGTSHSFIIEKDEDCVAATLLHGKLNFSSLPLRLFARLLGH